MQDAAGTGLKSMITAGKCARVAISHKCFELEELGLSLPANLKSTHNAVPTTRPMPLFGIWTLVRRARPF